MAARLSDRLWDMDDLAKLVEDWEIAEGARPEWA
jgi:hypothetical protein